MPEKVLTHIEEPTEVHWVTGRFVAADHALCGEFLHAAGSTHIVNDKIPVTCDKCTQMCEKLIEEVGK